MPMSEHIMEALEEAEEKRWVYDPKCFSVNDLYPPRPVHQPSVALDVTLPNEVDRILFGLDRKKAEDGP